jgi:hypothetical protein
VAQLDGNPNEQAVLASTDEELGQMQATFLSGPGYLVLPPGAFTWDGYTTGAGEPGMFFISIAGGFLTGRVETNACLVAPVQLPEGVRITGLEARVEDRNDGAEEYFQLWRTSLTSGISEKIAEIPGVAGTTGGLVALVTHTVQDPIVDNMYTYQIATCARPDIEVYGMRVGYSYGIALPLITR